MKKKGMLRMLLLALLAGVQGLSLCAGAESVQVSDRSVARSLGYEYLSPAPQARHVMPETMLVLRFEGRSAADIEDLGTCVEILGEASGRHPGRARVATDGQTLLFDPDTDLRPGEAVEVVLSPVFADPRASVQSIRYTFLVGEPAPEGLEDPNAPDCAGSDETDVDFQAGQARIMAGGVSVPSDFPSVTVTVSHNPDPGCIFLTNWGGPPYALILNNLGEPVWYRRMAGETRDLKVQANGLLTLLNRTADVVGTEYVGLDRTYTQVASFHAVNGYRTDEHELQVLYDGGYLLLGKRACLVHMADHIPGDLRTVSVLETVVQEFTRAGDLILQWRGWDDFDLAQIAPDELTKTQINFPHMNAIAVDEDGHLLVSCRHVSEVTKVHRRTGEVLWRLGGPNNRFRFVDQPLGGFSRQHDIRALGKGRYTLFDNGNDHVPPVSRAVEYALDVNAMTATRVWEFRDTPDRYTHFMGNAQRLAGGHTIINWASKGLPKLTEVRPDGTKSFEMDFAQSAYCYRVFRFPWASRASTPYLVAESHPDRVTLIVNQFGDPNVEHYRLYGGTGPGSTDLLAVSRTTLLDLTHLTSGLRYYFRATSVDRQGRTSDFSNEEQVVVRFVAPGQNMVINGDFSLGAESWACDVTAPGGADWEVREGVAHVTVRTAGEDRTAVQLVQGSLPLVRGSKYRLTFRAWAGTPRVIEARVGQRKVSWVNYSRTNPFFITTRPPAQPVSREFVMTDATDYDAAIVFSLGGSTGTVNVDDVSLELLETP